MAATTRPLGTNGSRGAEGTQKTKAYPWEAEEIRFAALAVASSDWSCARCKKQQQRRFKCGGDSAEDHERVENKVC